jgi:hypothetical protein
MTITIFLLPESSIEVQVASHEMGWQPMPEYYLFHHEHQYFIGQCSDAEGEEELLDGG